MRELPTPEAGLDAVPQLAARLRGVKLAVVSASLSNGRGSAGGYVNIYAGAPGFVLPDKQARGLFRPLSMQSDPVNSLTGALAAVETDASVDGRGASR